MSEVERTVGANERLLARVTSAHRRLRAILAGDSSGRAVVGLADFHAVYNDFVTGLSALYSASGGPGWRGFHEFDDAYRLFLSYDRGRAEVFADVRRLCRDKLIEGCNFKVFPEAKDRATLRHLTLMAEERSRMLAETMKEAEDCRLDPNHGRPGLAARIKALLTGERAREKVPAHKRVGLIRWLISFELRVSTLFPVVEREIQRFKAARYPISKEDLWSLRAMSDDLVSSQCPPDRLAKVTADIELIAETALFRAQEIKKGKEIVTSQEQANLSGKVKLKLADAKEARKELAIARGVEIEDVPDPDAPKSAPAVVIIGKGTLSDLLDVASEIEDDDDFGEYSRAGYAGKR